MLGAAFLRERTNSVDRPQEKQDVLAYSMGIVACDEDKNQYSVEYSYLTRINVRCGMVTNGAAGRDERRFFVVPGMSAPNCVIDMK